MVEKISQYNLNRRTGSLVLVVSERTGLPQSTVRGIRDTMRDLVKRYVEKGLSVYICSELYVRVTLKGQVGNNTGLVIPYGFLHRQVAETCGVSVDTVSRVLDEFFLSVVEVAKEGVNGLFLGLALIHPDGKVRKATSLRYATVGKNWRVSFHVREGYQKLLPRTRAQGTRAYYAG